MHKLRHQKAAVSPFMTFGVRVMCNYKSEVQQIQPRPEQPPETSADDAVAEVGKKEGLDPLMPIVIPNQGEDSRPVPKQVQCLENGTDLFKMFEVDMNKFDASQTRKAYHKMATFVHPDKLGREPTDADRARITGMCEPSM
eukprot:g25679.t1